MNNKAFSSVQEYFQLLGLNILVHCRNFWEFLRVASRYYSNNQFRRIDLSLLTSYFLNSPFAISKEFLKKKGERDLYAYGETPLTTLEYIANNCQINASDVVFELGCGRGRTCFWLNAFKGCRVVGVDFVPVFVERANEIKSKYQVKNVEFRLQDMMLTDLSGATVIYLYGTSLNDGSIKKLIERFKTLPAGTKIITVSYPLSDYVQEQFEVMSRFQARFPWGEADIYLNIKR